MEAVNDPLAGFWALTNEEAISKLSANKNGLNDNEAISFAVQKSDHANADRGCPIICGAR
jgi:hypothetical protein